MIPSTKPELITVISKKIFRLQSRGFLLELQHTLSGLPKGSVLQSVESGLCWSVEARILFDHIKDQQKIGKGESLIHMISKFTSEEDQHKSAQELLAQESQGIYQYLLKAIDHQAVPLPGEMLRSVQQK
ncbi:MAG: hypothetical protein MUF42_13275 [Cytophagaceae bacterium]|jgi:hypothetical protein|nr:hypothetical protein [Cytophagaceae bacterium]